MVNAMNTMSSTRGLVAVHRAISAIKTLSPFKIWASSIVLISVVMVVWSQLSPASFKNAWLSKDQQAALYFQDGQYKKASALFDAPEWKAFSTYFSGDFAFALEQFENLTGSDVRLVTANAYAHSGQFEKAQVLYKGLSQDKNLSNAAKENYEVVSSALEKLKNAPPEKSKNKSIDDRQIVSEESDEKSDKAVILSDQIWLEQVRQNPSNFLRQKFQSEYANEQN